MEGRGVRGEVEREGVRGEVERGCEGRWRERV